MIEDKYIKQRPKSKALHEKAVNVFPSGITHDIRYILPFPNYIAETMGSKKWDVDGNEYVDFAMGHGALLLGHGREEVISAAREVINRGTHYGGSSELEVRWGEIVKNLIPSAERVKFTSSGTEATLLAVRLARAFTGKSKIIKFLGHFHGWHDYLIRAERPPWEQIPAGVPYGVLKTVAALPCDRSVESVLVSDNDIAGVIIEPTGGSWGKVPVPDGFLGKIRELTGKHGVVLIFDEVVTGFRWSPGGAQGLYGITPDLTTLAKILAGGFPGGAVAGKSDIMELLQFSGDDEKDQRSKIRHQGTFNANPVSATAGFECLKIASTGQPQREAAGRAADIRKALNGIIKLYEIEGCVYGDSSVFHITMGVRAKGFTGGDIRDPELPPDVLKTGMEKGLAKLFQLSMLVEGVDLFHLGGLVSSVHTDEDAEKTVRAFENTIRRLRKEGILK